MSSQANQIPDAWDDEWENQVDTPDSEPSAQSEPAKKVSTRAIKAQKRAQHAEFNRQLWAEAETPQTFHFLESRSTVPVKSDYKPAVKVLTRKPQNSSGTPSYGVDSTTAGMQRLVISPSGLPSSPPTTTTAADRKYILFNNKGTDMSDEERKRQEQMTIEERQAKTQREREEKQRKYEEVRERLFGTSTPGSGTSSPGSTTPPRQQQQQGGGDGKWKGGRNRSAAGNNKNNNNTRERRENSSASNRSRQLFDPTYSPKPNSNYVQRKERQQMSNERDDETFKPQSPQIQPQPQAQAPIRSPRGPDGSGRGGFGFSQRGAKGS